jgi:hypothetical protein
VPVDMLLGVAGRVSRRGQYQKCFNLMKVVVASFATKSKLCPSSRYARQCPIDQATHLRDVL